MRRQHGGRVLATALVLVSVAGAASPAAAVQTEAWTEVVQGRYLRLESVADWERAGRLQPGETVRWDVEVSASAPEPGLIAIGVSATGDAILRIDARLCALPWRGEECPGGATSLRRGWEVPRDGGTVVLARTEATAVSRLRLDVALGQSVQGQGEHDQRDPGRESAVRRATTEVRVHADGAGDAVQVGPGLPPTGEAVPVFGIVGGAVLLVLGVGALLVTGARRRREKESDAAQEEHGAPGGRP